jgi:hypothetical protein
MPSTSVTRPPIPQAPLVDPRTGMVTREWWRWFAAVGTASVATTASITNITNDITNIIEEAQPIPLLDDPSDPADVMRQALLLRNPGECACDLDDAAKRALRFIPPADAIGPQLDDLLRKVLELVRPVDQVATDQLMQALDRPGDQLPLDQLAIAAQLLAVPADPSSDQLALLAQVLALPVPSPIPSMLVVGTLTSDAAPTGNLGEWVSNQAAFQNLTSGTAVNGAQVTLSPGDYDVRITAAFPAVGGTVNVTGIAFGLSTTSATFDGTTPHVTTTFLSFTINSAIGGYVTSQTPIRYSLSTTKTIYGVIEALFTLGTASALQGNARIEVRRVR